jgi:spore photoproduct lyase
LKNLKQICYNPDFSHIYVEKRVWEHPRTKQILSHFAQAKIIAIDHYKDVFNRRGQDRIRQQQSKSLILAAKEDHFFYEGAPVCQDFGNTNFYYCSTMMNCVYDCSYCYLKGMYPSGHLVIFVNLEDYFRALEAELLKHSMYLCVSYDADLLALEPVAGYAAQWAEFASKQDNLTLEIRTKSANMAMWEALPVLSNVIYAFTVSPQNIVDSCEHGTPSAEARLRCCCEGIKRGYPVRLCFDPMLRLPAWREDYASLLDTIDRIFAEYNVKMSSLSDVSVGCFRISQDYMKAIRRLEPYDAVVQFPYVNQGGYYQYPPKLRREMEEYLIGELVKRIDRGKIYQSN